MKQHLLFSSILFFFFLSFSNAQTIWNVNNLNNGVQADFTTLQDAINGASAGDVIQLHPSPTSYGTGTIDKKLTIIGVGYDILDNADSTGIQTYTLSAIVNDLYIYAGAEQSVIIGLDMHSTCQLNSVSNVLIQRNKIYANLNVSYCHDLVINGNYFSVYNGFDRFKIDDSSSNIIVTNNIFDDINGYANVNTYNSSLATFEHNIFLCPISVSNCSFKNNIFLNDHYPNISTNIIENNVFTSNEASIPAGNTTGVDGDSIFVGVPTQAAYSDDGRFYLKAGSPAIGAGENGVDAGVFAGDSPYKLSGLPFIPVIYEVNAPSSGTSGSGLPVNIKVKANN